MTDPVLVVALFVQAVIAFVAVAVLLLQRNAADYKTDAVFWMRYAVARKWQPKPVRVEVLPQFNPPVVIFTQEK